MNQAASNRCSLCTSALVMLAVALLAPAIGAQTIVAPNDPADTDSRSNSAPFNDTSRLQSIYASSQFSTLSQPEYITQIAFRPGYNQGAFSDNFTGIEFDLSTTSQTVSGLSATFANNVGANNVVAFNGPLAISSAGTPSGTDFGAFDIVINLTTPFLYNPTAGNLLLDIRNFSSGTAGDLDLDSDSSATSPVALVFVDNSTTAATGSVQTVGIIAQFTFSTVPEPATWAYLGAGAALFAFVSVRRSNTLR